MESRHSVGWPICHDYVKIFAQKLSFWKTTPCGTIFKILFRKDSPPLRSTCCVQISWNLADRKLAKSRVVSLTKKIQNFGSLCLLRGSHPKSVRASSKQCSQSYSPMCEHRSNAPQSVSNTRQSLLIRRVMNDNWPPKITEFKNSRFRIQQQVLRLNVTVTDTLWVQVGKASEHLVHIELHTHTDRPPTVLWHLSVINNNSCT